MSISKYIRVGLRADKNLADLQNKPIALSNVLDDLIPNQSFIPGDLTVINGLNTTDVWANDLKELTTLTETYSPLTLSNSGDISIGAPQDIQPRARVIDIIKNDEIILGTPPVGQGGDGPIAKIFPAVALTASNATLTTPSTTVTADSVFDSNNVNIVTSSEYWVDGRFGFGSTFHPTFSDQFGGISWEGWMENSSRRDVHLQTNGFILVEKYDEDTDEWVTTKASYSESFTAEVSDDNLGATTIVVTGEYVPYMWVGLIVNGTHEVTGWSRTENRLTLASLAGQANITVNAGDTITLTREVGEMIYTDFIPTDAMIPNATQKVRITTWYPRPDDFSPPRTSTLYKPFGMFWDMDIQIRLGLEQSNAGESTPYSSFYSQKRGGESFVPKQYSYEYFERNVISTRNRHLPNYFQNDAPLYIRYEGKTQVRDKARFDTQSGSPYQISWVNLKWLGGYTFYTDNDSILQNLNIGDYLIFHKAGGTSTENYFLQVYEMVGDFIQVEPFKGYDMDAIMGHYSYAIDSVVEFFAFNPTGVAGIYTQKTTSTPGAGNASLTYELHPMLNSDDQNNDDTDFNMPDPIVGDLMLNLGFDGSGSQSTHPEVFDKITTISKFADRIEVNAEPAYTSMANPASARKRTQNTPVIIYSHRGLIDASASAQCQGVYGREVAAHGSFNVAGQKGLALTTIDGITQGDYVQFLGAVSGTPDANGNATGSVTTVQSIDAVNSTIQLSQNLLADIPAARTVVFSQNNPGTANKELCVMPLNTAPPFEGTDLGLETTSNFPNLNVNGEFSISGIKFESATSTEITNNNQANSGLLIKTPSGAKYWALMDS